MTRRAPGDGSARSATRCARSSRTPTPTVRRRWRRRWTSRAGGSRRRTAAVRLSCLITGLAQASRRRTLHPGREPTLVGELVKVRGERHGGGRAQLRRDVTPGCVEHLGNRSSSRIEPATSRRSRSSRCATYSSSFAAGSSDQRSVARADQPQRSTAESCEAREVTGQRAGVWRDEHASLAEHGVAGERDVGGHEREVVGRVARRDHRLAAVRTARPSRERHRPRREPRQRRQRGKRSRMWRRRASL